jgi:uncharacterized protein
MAGSKPSDDGVTFQKATVRLAAALSIGGAGGALFASLQLPLPWLLGALAATITLLLLAFIPGGLPEMSLIALGLGADPAFVVPHHAARVFLVVLIALPVSAWLRRSGWLGTPSAGPPS